MKTTQNILACTLLFIGIQNSHAQNNTLQTPMNAEKILEVKFSIDNTFSIYPNYSIQIETSKDEEAINATHQHIQQTYPDLNTTIIQTKDQYKLFAGNYKNKIEAYALLQKINKLYPNAYMVYLK